MQDDETLAARMRAGDREALGDLARAWQDRLYRVAYLHCGNADDALDLVQETLLAAWSSIGGYLPGTRFDAWLMRLAANRAVSWRRKERMRRHAPLTSEPISSAIHPIEEQERKEAVRKALSTLPDRERLMLVLRTVEGLSPAAIAEALGLGTASVSVSLSRARARLRQAMESEIVR